MQENEQPAARTIFGSLEAWARHYLPVNFSQPSSAMHRWLFDRCEYADSTRGTKINLIGPRGGAKSTVGSFAYPLRCAVEGTEPLIYLIAETRDQACEYLLNVKDQLAENESLARAYPDACGKGSIWRSDRIRLRNGVVIAAYGVGQKIRGRRRGAERPTLVICDDVQSEPVMTSADIRTKGWNWFDGSVMKAGSKRTTFINLATALHRDAIAMRLDRTPGWESKVFAAVIHWPAKMDLWHELLDVFHDLSKPNRKQLAQAMWLERQADLSEGASTLWPEEEDLFALMTAWSVNRSTFEREKQGRAINTEDCEWPEEYFENIWFDEWPDRHDVKAMTLDPSKGKDAKKSDFSAYVWGMLMDGTLYVDANLARRPPNQIVTDGISLWRAFRPHVFGVEANAMQELFVDMFDKQFATHDIKAGVVPIFNMGNKVVRIRSLGPMLGRKRIKFKRGSAGAEQLVGQLRDFPDKHSHDDGPDALEMLTALMADWLNEH